jgi:hypothetical protein
MILLAAIVAVVSFVAVPGSAQNLAPTPPMGWNSWDAYGFTIDEADFKANAKVLAGMEQFGWRYMVIDEGWYMQDPYGATLEQRKYIWDGNGNLLPDPKRYPSSVNGAGFKPLADWVHAQGLKFGIHIVRGIPRQVVKANLPIEGTSFHAEDASDPTSPCSWDDGNWGVKDNAAGQAYYDSMLKLYAAWGLDFLKVDCISSRPYRPTEIRQIAEAIKKTGRPIVLSLSPGPTDLKDAEFVGQYAQMWRTSDDHWDGWTFKQKPEDGEYPFGVRDAFDRLAQWSIYSKPGNWPDQDMLPWGYLGPHPGVGEARQSRETREEQRTELALWAISRSPLIVDANLTRLDDFTRSLMTNQNMLFIDQNLTYSHPLETAKLPGFEHARVWQGTINEPGARVYQQYVAFFNLDDKPATLKATWKELGLAGGKYRATNVWTDEAGKESKEINVVLPAHGSAVYELK